MIPWNVVSGVTDLCLFVLVGLLWLRVRRLEKAPKPDGAHDSKQR